MYQIYLQSLLQLNHRSNLWLRDVSAYNNDLEARRGALYMLAIVEEKKLKIINRMKKAKGL